MNPTPIPAEIEELCLEHDRVFEEVKDRSKALTEQAVDAIDRESTHELAESIEGIADDLHQLLEDKDNAGYFTGSADAEQHARERAVHLRADQRRLFSDLRSVAREFRSGKSSKARRQLSAWVSKFTDIGERESRHISELWSTS